MKIIIESFADTSIIDIRGDTVSEFSFWTDSAHILENLELTSENNSEGIDQIIS